MGVGANTRTPGIVPVGPGAGARTTLICVLIGLHTFCDFKMHGGEAHARTPKIVGVPHSPLIGRQTEQRIIYIVVSAEVETLLNSNAQHH